MFVGDCSQVYDSIIIDFDRMNDLYFQLNILCTQGQLTHTPTHFKRFQIFPFAFICSKARVARRIYALALQNNLNLMCSNFYFSLLKILCLFLSQI